MHFIEQYVKNFSTELKWVLWIMKTKKIRNAIASTENTNFLVNIWPVLLQDAVLS